MHAFITRQKQYRALENNETDEEPILSEGVPVPSVGNVEVGA